MTSSIPQRSSRILLIGLGGLLILLGTVIAGVILFISAPWDDNIVEPTMMMPAPSEVQEVEAPEETPGVFPTQIVFGQSAALSGPASGLGVNMRRGIEAAFFEANQNGGVQGRQLSLISMDDAYEPGIAITNTNTLIELQEVFALIGAVGTPTSRSAAPIANEAGIPYLTPFTGADFLRDVSKTQHRH